MKTYYRKLRHRRLPRIHMSPFLRDIGLTAVTSCATIASLVAVTTLLAKGLGPELFGAYSLAKRTIATVVPFTTMALGVSLARYTALHPKEEDQKIYLASSIAIITTLSFFILIVGWFGRDLLTRLIFQDPFYQSLFLATIFSIIGYGYYTVLYAFYRGRMQMAWANIWQICIMAIAPLIVSVIWAQSKKTAVIILLMGCAFYASLPAILLKLHSGRILQKADHFKHAVGDLLRYGIPRTPGALAYAAFLSLGPYLTASFHGLEDAGNFVVGQSIFRVIESIFVFFGLVALPKITKYVADNQERFIAERISDLLSLIFHMGFFFSIQVAIWSNRVIALWLGADYMVSTKIIKVLMVALIPYLLFIMLRSVIDAAEVKPVNTVNIFISLGIGAVISVVWARQGGGATEIACGTMIGFFVLGALTVNYIRGRFGFAFGKTKPVGVIIANGMLGLMAIMADRWVFGNEPVFMQFLKIAVIEGIMLLGYLSLLWFWQVRWIDQLKARVSIH